MESESVKISLAQRSFELVETYKQFIIQRIASTQNRNFSYNIQVEIVLLNIPENVTRKFVVAFRPINVNANFTILWDFVINSSARETVEDCFNDIAAYINKCKIIT